ncbi:TonB-dependent receptor [Dysgonomonas sp. OttesenSCG-928-D17]|nr:TonB-dependent receptor [Dysgonomonas sp. OttesenSCG-928-D17]
MFAVLLIFISSVHLGYAQNTKTITGTITDELNDPIIGASIIVENTSVGTITNTDGNFTLNVPAGTQRLKVSYVGFISQTIDIANRTSFKIALKEDQRILDEIVVVGYGTQKKATLTGSVAAINSEELMATKNSNVQNMLTGKIAGVRVIQKTSEPGEFNNQFDIRGFGNPLVVVDGVPRGDFSRMDPNDIESISVLKDASAAVYGVRAANGVVLITTKKGEKGTAKIEYSMYYGIQNPIERLKPVGAVDRMTLFNERSMRSTTDPKLTFSQDQINEYLTGQKVSTDWYDEVMKSTATQQQHNVSLSGGGDKVDYYVNLGYTEQGGFFKSNSLNYDRYNLRANLNAQITKNLKASLKLNGIIDQRDRPRASTWEIYKTLWRSIPSETVYANNRVGYYDKPNGDIQNVVAMADSDVSGYIKNKKRLFQSTMDLTYDVPFITGLSAKGLFSYDTTVDDNTEYTKEYNEYNYDEATDTYSAVPKNVPSRLNRRYNTSYTRLWQVSLNYNRMFANTHNVSGLLLWEESYNQSDNIWAQRDLEIPIPYLFAGNSANQIGNGDGISEYASNGLVGKFNYDYKGKYLAEFSFRYDGSSKFPKDSRWGFFPSASVGWRLSEEEFIKKAIPFADNLKIRASYGKMGDDSAAKYQFLSGYNYPNTDGNTQDNYPRGYVFGGEFINGLGFRSVANPYITWYTVKTMNLGLDADLWKGLFGFSIDLFQRNRDGLLADRLISLPGTFGSTMPQENINSDRTKGFELELRHRNKVGEVNYNVTGIVSITRSMNRFIESATRGNSYDYWRNNRAYRYNDIWFGKGDNGRYTSYDQIANSPIFTGNGTLPGDYIYEDWNGDGVIDAMDEYPIATTTDANKANLQDKRNYPLMNFSMNISADYKGFDLNLMFQGSAMSYVAYGEQLSMPLLWEGNALGMMMDRWHPSDATKDPFDPSNQWVSGYYAYGAIGYDVNSRFAIQNGAYLRLKSAEIGYTLPTSLIGKVGIKRMRVYTNVYNLFTITSVKGVDPERPTELYGYMYPLNRTINFGASITF